MPTAMRRWRSSCQGRAYSALRILGALAMDAVGTGRVAACRPGGAAPVGVYKPRWAQASPLFRLVNDQFRTLRG